MDLSVVIPAFNESNRIRATLKDYAPAVTQYGGELLVVVNGSHDDTEHIVRDEFMPAFPCIRLIVIPEQVGKGGALMRGFRDATGPKIGYTDADGSTPSSSFLALVDALGTTEGIVFGSRWLKDSKVEQAQPFARQFVSRMFNLLVRLLFGMKFRDTQCGAKVMHQTVVRDILPDIGSTQWAFDVELLFHIRRKGYDLREFPVEWHDRTGSKVKVFKSASEMTLALTRLRLLHSPFKGLVKLWDSGPGRRLYDKRLKRMQHIYRKSDHP
jgi:glycosyltransferase involved in cell wall biosynthesis